MHYTDWERAQETKYIYFQSSIKSHSFVLVLLYECLITNLSKLLHISPVLGIWEKNPKYDRCGLLFSGIQDFIQI